MYLKRMFKDGKPHCVKLLHYGKRWNPSTRVVSQGIMEGWLMLGGGKLVLKTPDDTADIEYQIELAPGRYCAFCNEPVADEATARAHLATMHDGEVCPDQNNPSGWKVLSGYQCRLVGDAPDLPQGESTFWDTVGKFFNRAVN